MRYSKKEVIDLFKAWLVLSLAFTIAFRGSQSNLFVYFFVSAFTVGIAFLLHELAHKFVAQHFNYWAEFRSFDHFFVITLLLSLFGFIIAAPGAVMIRGRVSPRKNGLISIAGPLTNVVLAVGFIILNFLFPVYSSFFYLGKTINAVLAVFNLIPFGFFDGRKVFDWNKPVWGVLIGISIVLMIV